MCCVPLNVPYERSSVLTAMKRDSLTRSSSRTTSLCVVALVCPIALLGVWLH